jgi:predicted membrane-bound spermidine synthase
LCDTQDGNYPITYSAKAAIIAAIIAAVLDSDNDSDSGSDNGSDSDSHMNTTPDSHPLLLPTVFLAGVGTLGIEMVMPRLLAPFFGTSQPIWAVVIGMTLIYLAIGYRLGGVLADTYPRQQVLYRLIAWAGLLCGCIPLLSHPILRTAQQSLSGFAAGGFIAALLAVVLLFAAPVILLATVSPFAIRLQINRAADGIEAAGRTAGTISSLSTLGSIIGTFLSVLVLIPTIGTQLTIYLFALLMLTLGLLGLGDWRYVWMVVVVVVLASYTLTMHKYIKLADCQGCELLAETESSYNYIQVVFQPETGEGVLPDWRRNLVLNEGHAVHSTYRLQYEYTHHPLDLLTGGPWDYFAAAPYFYPNRSPQDVGSFALLGSAVGTIPKQMLALYGEEMHIDAVEIDPRIIELGREYFAMEDLQTPNYTVYAADARYWLNTTDQTYDIIGMDAYHQPYIPFHLTTVEFFREVRDHLNEQGVVVVNAGRPPSGDEQLEQTLAATMLAVFPQVFMMDTQLPRSASVLIVGVNQPVGDGVAHFRANAARLPSGSVLRVVMDRAINEGKKPVREVLPEEVASIRPFTDDLAPIEQLIDSMIAREVQYLAR